jgi:plastocyanin
MFYPENANTDNHNEFHLLKYYRSLQKSSAVIQFISLNQFKMKTKFISCLTMLIILVAMNSCSKSSSYVPVNPGNNDPTPGAYEVWMQNRTFVPATKTVAVGTTITWTNKDTDSHDVQSDTGVFSSPSMGKNGVFTFTFTMAGTYKYSCAFHSGMNGTIIVQ